MKHLNTYITEYIVKKKLDKAIDSEHKYHPQTKEELVENIKELLDKANIKYKQEYIFSDMPNRRYDFAIFNNNGEIIQLIEFDGEQHFIEAPFFKTTLKEQQDIDTEKNEYAKNHNIKLIRISYVVSELQQTN